MPDTAWVNEPQPPQWRSDLTAGERLDVVAQMAEPSMPVCCGQHGNLCHLADGPTDLCCNECLLMAGHIQLVGYNRSDQNAEDLPDDVFDAAVRALLQCPDVASHAHVRIEMLRSMAAGQYPDGVLRQAFNVVWVAGIKHGLDIAETLEQSVIDDRAGAELDALLGRLDNDEQRRILGELLDRHPQTGDLLDPAPFIRRAQLEAIIDAVDQLLGVNDAW